MNKNIYHNIDFFKFKTDKKYDFIFGNPPYNIKVDNKTIYDVDFFNRCYELLNYKIIFLMSSTSLRLKTKSHQKFIKLIDIEETSRIRREEQLIDESRLFRFEKEFKKGKTSAGTTNITTLLFVIEKND